MILDVGGEKEKIRVNQDWSKEDEGNVTSRSWNKEAVETINKS